MNRRWLCYSLWSNFADKKKKQRERERESAREKVAKQLNALRFYFTSYFFHFIYMSSQKFFLLFLQLSQLNGLAFCGSSQANTCENVCSKIKWRRTSTYAQKLRFSIGSRSVRRLTRFVSLQVKKDDRISSFQDSKLNDGVIVTKVIEAIKPGIVNWDNVNQDAREYDVRPWPFMTMWSEMCCISSGMALTQEMHLYIVVVVGL